jgi:hypothetical protein
MGIGLAPKINNLQLSKGQTFTASYVLGSNTYPTGTTASIIIYDNSEIVLATWTGTVSGVTATFTQTAPDTIPHGSKFDLFLIYSNGNKIKHSYGIVVRNENRYPLNPTEITTNYALQFSDSFNRTYVGKYWVPRSADNAVSIHDNSGTIPNTLGPNNSLFTSAAVLWYTPLNTDSVTVTASMVNIGSGKCTLVVASDYNMTTWVGVQFETGISNNKLWIVRGTGPINWTTQSGTTSVNNTLTTGDTYVVKFNAVSKLISCFKNGSGTAAISGTATGLPTGAGYRYSGIVWNSSLFSPGAEPSTWSAKDGL